MTDLAASHFPKAARAAEERAARRAGTPLEAYAPSDSLAGLDGSLADQIDQEVAEDADPLGDGLSLEEADAIADKEAEAWFAEQDAEDTGEGGWGE